MRVQPSSVRVFLQCCSSAVKVFGAPQGSGAARRRSRRSKGGGVPGSRRAPAACAGSACAGRQGSWGWGGAWCARRKRRTVKVNVARARAGKEEGATPATCSSRTWCVRGMVVAVWEPEEGYSSPGEPVACPRTGGCLGMVQNEHKEGTNRYVQPVRSSKKGNVLFRRQAAVCTTR